MAVSPAISPKNSKRQAEATLEKQVTAKKHKREVEAEIQQVTSSLEDSSSESKEEEVVAQAALLSKKPSFVVSKNGSAGNLKKAKPASSSESEIDSDDDEVLATKKLEGVSAAESTPSQGAGHDVIAATLAMGIIWSTEMSRTGSLKDENDRKNVHLQRNSNEGTSARTRPFSFKEIMLRRQNKKFAADANDAEPMNLSDRYTAINAFSHPDSVPVKPVKEDTLKGASRKKEEIWSRKEDDLVKDKANWDLGTNLRLRSKKNSSSRDRGEKIEKLSHFRNRTMNV
ncbi:uncharacterized protein [Aristolochia californica]|uniref:uncharacterized protein n=1 Tax=Aristolochia californica TaxID=171875 RepID=UPI0035D8BBBA